MRKRERIREREVGKREKKQLRKWISMPSLCVTSPLFWVMHFNKNYLKLVEPEPN